MPFVSECGQDDEDGVLGNARAEQRLAGVNVEHEEKPELRDHEDYVVLRAHLHGHREVRGRFWRERNSGGRQAERAAGSVLFTAHFHDE